MAESATEAPATYEQSGIYECPACREVYADSRDAADCCHPEEVEGYVCLACDTAHRTEQEAAACRYCDGMKRCECVHVKRRHFAFERLEASGARLGLRSCLVQDCPCAEFTEAVSS